MENKDCSSCGHCKLTINFDTEQVIRICEIKEITVDKDNICSSYTNKRFEIWGVYYGKINNKEN